MTADIRDLEISSIEYEVDLIMDIQFMILDLMREQSISKSELASRLGVSKARLSNIFSAEANLTLRTVARVMHALGSELKVLPQRLGQERSDPDHTDSWIFLEKKSLPVNASRGAGATNDNWADIFASRHENLTSAKTSSVGAGNLECAA